MRCRQGVGRVFLLFNSFVESFQGFFLYIGKNYNAIKLLGIPETILVFPIISNQYAEAGLNKKKKNLLLKAFVGAFYDLKYNN